ncbi:MAG: hypothetical protein EZS28_034299, partial [Streblomastix strix]
MPPKVTQQHGHAPEPPKQPSPRGPSPRGTLSRQTRSKPQPRQLFMGHEPGNHGRRVERKMELKQPINVFQGATAYDQSVDEDDWVPPTNLPAQY